MNAETEVLGKEKLFDLCRVALDASSADQTQVTVNGGDSALTRFARSNIHQNVAERNYEITVKIAAGKKLGIASSNQLSEESIRLTTRTAVELARHQPDNPDFVSFPEPGDSTSSPVMFYPATIQFGPDKRAAAVSDIVKTAQQVAGATVSGSLSISANETAIVNSQGIKAYASSSSASLVVVCQTVAGGVGYADAHSRDITNIDFSAVAREAAHRCKLNVNPHDLEPGEYDVVLLPYAVIDLLEPMCWGGFGAMAFQEGRSFMSGRLGEKLMGENISIWDDGLDSQGFSRAFDGEGIAKQRVDLIDEGVASGVVYDSFTAFKEGKYSTGHGWGGPPAWGPSARNIFLKPGDASIDEMISGTKRGLLVTRFHYTNILQEKQAIITGMTRDGTFLIENGTVKTPVKNLRFTEGMLRAFSNVEALGSELKVAPTVCAPAAKIKSFRFTSATEF